MMMLMMLWHTIRLWRREKKNSWFIYLMLLLYMHYADEDRNGVATSVCGVLLCVFRWEPDEPAVWLDHTGPAKPDPLRAWPSRSYASVSSPSHRYRMTWLPISWLQDLRRRGRKWGWWSYWSGLPGLRWVDHGWCFTLMCGYEKG